MPRPSAMRLSIAICLACLFGFSISVLGQPISAGIVGGGTLTQDFQNQTIGDQKITSTPIRWMGGGMIELRLPFHLAVEADGLYHELKYTVVFLNPNGPPSGPSLAHPVTWEFPVMAKYRFSLPKMKSSIRPLVEGGPIFRTAGDLNGARPSNHGFTAGAGVELRAWKLRVAPQLRYTRWAADPFSFAPTVPNQVELLASVSF